jgi:hypothetical protein
MSAPLGMYGSIAPELCSLLTGHPTAARISTFRLNVPLFGRRGDISC